MTEVLAKSELVARCGLYCGACKSYLNGKCAGCHENSRATWCAIRTCCADKGIATCAECAKFPDPRACGKFNNFMSKMFGLVFRSNRAACIEQIRNLGIDGHAQVMAGLGIHTIRR